MVTRDIDVTDIRGRRSCGSGARFGFVDLLTNETELSAAWSVAPQSVPCYDGAAIFVSPVTVWLPISPVEINQRRVIGPSPVSFNRYIAKPKPHDGRDDLYAPCNPSLFLGAHDTD